MSSVVIWGYGRRMIDLWWFGNLHGCNPFLWVIFLGNLVFKEKARDEWQCGGKSQVNNNTNSLLLISVLILECFHKLYRHFSFDFRFTKQKELCNNQSSKSKINLAKKQSIQ